MYCKNCGAELNDNAAVCLKCGVNAGVGNNYCPNCGATTAPNAAVCTTCGVALSRPSAFGSSTGSKSKLVAGLLGIFLGSLGIHNFYLGYTKKAVIQLLITIVGSFLVVGPLIAEIWGLIEGIQILTGKINCDANGVPLAD